MTDDAPASPSSVTTVVFDLGNVLLDWDPRRLYRTLIDNPAELEDFLATVCTPAWNDRQDRGRSIAAATAELVEQFPDRAELIGAYYGRWADMVGGAMPATVDILRELRDGGVRLLGLTNWPAETFEPTRERYGFFAWFDGIVVSGLEGIAKPDEAIFTRLLERYDVDPAAAVFIDDNAGHVAAARRLGLHGLVFTGASRLRRDLAALGLPVAADVDVRAASPADAAAITEIYNHYVLESAATFDLDPVSLANREEWLGHYLESGPHQALVATVADRVVGYATSSQFRPKRAYDTSVEVSVYLAPGVERRGIGSMLYQELFHRLRGEPLHRAYAAISLPNPGSIALHERFGFVDVGTLREVGRKHDAWWDVRFMERPLP